MMDPLWHHCHLTSIFLFFLFFFFFLFFRPFPITHNTHTRTHATHCTCTSDMVTEMVVGWTESRTHCSALVVKRWGSSARSQWSFLEHLERTHTHTHTHSGQIAAQKTEFTFFSVYQTQTDPVYRCPCLSKTCFVCRVSVRAASVCAGVDYEQRTYSKGCGWCCSCLLLWEENQSAAQQSNAQAGWEKKKKKKKQAGQRSVAPKPPLH